MRVAQRVHREAAEKIQIGPAFVVVDVAAAPALENGGGPLVRIHEKAHFVANGSP